MIFTVKKIAALMLIMLTLCFGGCSPENRNNRDDSAAPPEDIYLPPLGEDARELVSLSDIVYERPDAFAIVSEAELLTEEIENGSLSYDAIIEKICNLDESYAGFSTMLTYMMLKNSADSADSYCAEEYEYLKAAAPSLTKAFEELFVAAARSEFANRLEDEVFWEGFIEEYADGSIYNDLVVSLLESEAEIESRYSSLSTVNVKITFGGVTDTYDNIIKDLKSRYNEGSQVLKKAISDCDRLFSEAVAEESADIYVELLGVRRRLADTLGYASYGEYAYDILGHGYTEGEMNGLISDIAEYAIPVYASLSTRAFAGYFKTHSSPTPDRGRVINGVYSALTKIDPSVSEAYAYMLNCGLYDIDKERSNRLEGAFTTYLYGIESPYIFATLGGDITDYMTVSHEFGHFYDAYVNYNSEASLDLLEVSSTGLELLVLSHLGDKLSESEYKYLYYAEMSSVFEALIFQAFYAKFEALAYALPYDEISKERLDLLVTEAAEYMHLNTEYFTGIEDVMIYHLIMEPFYVQSYCTATVAALDIFFMECDKAGAGRDAYVKLIDRQGESDLLTALSKASIPSPLRRGAVKEIADEIHYSIIGSYYFIGDSNINNAA